MYINTSTKNTCVWNNFFAMPIVTSLKHLSKNASLICTTHTFSWSTLFYVYVCILQIVPDEGTSGLSALFPFFGKVCGQACPVWLLVRIHPWYPCYWRTSKPYSPYSCSERPITKGKTMCVMYGSFRVVPGSRDTCAGRIIDCWIYIYIYLYIFI